MAKRHFNFSFLLTFIMAGCFCTGCSSSSGLGLFDKKPETTPAKLEVTQFENEDGKKTTITGTNDANAKDGMSAVMGAGGEVQIETGGSRKLEKWGESDNYDVASWGWAFLVFGGAVLLMRANGIRLAPASLGFGGIGIGLFNLTIAPIILPILTGAVWNLMCVGILIKFGVPGLWANLRDKVRGL